MRLLDQGYRKKPASGSTTPGELITGADGNPVNQPVLLDGSGEVLAEGGNPVFKEWEVDDWLPFSVLGVIV